MAAAHPFLTFLGQAVVIAIGWVVVHRLTERRDKEKTRREVLVKITDTLSDDVNDILWAAHGYHSKPREVVEELKLKMALQDLASRVGGISDIYAEQDILALARGQVGALRRAISGGHFEDEHTGPLPDSARQYALMLGAAQDLKRSLLSLKNRQLKVS